MGIDDHTEGVKRAWYRARTPTEQAMEIEYRR